MKRTFNYTERKRVEQKHIQVRLIEQSTNQTLIEVGIDLTDYGFPQTAKVFIEIRGESTFARRELENPFNPSFHQQFKFETSEVPENPIFHIRVFEPGSTGLLLGLADTVKFVNPENIITRQDALLTVRWGDIGQEIWQMAYDPLDGPTLKLSKNLQESIKKFETDPMFVGCVVPQAFRRVLEYAILSEDDFDVHDDENWFHEWHRWMSSVNQLRPVASRLEGIDPNDEDELQNWIDEAVGDFSKMSTNRFVTQVSSLLNSRD